MTAVVRHLRANAIAYLALFVALGGTSYAAFSLPRASVGTSQLKNHAITPIKLDPNRIGAYVRAWAVIENGNQIVEAKPRARVTEWDPADASGVITWSRTRVSKGCFPLASGGADFVQAAIAPGGSRSDVIRFGIYSNTGAPESNGPLAVVAVLCASP